MVCEFLTNPDTYVRENGIPMCVGSVPCLAVGDLHDPNPLRHIIHVAVVALVVPDALFWICMHCIGGGDGAHGCWRFRRVRRMRTVIHERQDEVFQPVNTILHVVGCREQSGGGGDSSA